MAAYLCFLCKIRLSEYEKIFLHDIKTKHTKTTLLSFMRSVLGLSNNTENAYVCSSCLDSIDQLDYFQMRCQQLKEQLLSSLKKCETQNQNLEFTCDMCSCNFYTESGLLLHVNKKHVNGEDCHERKVVKEVKESVVPPEEFKCQQRSVKHKTSTELKVHVLNEHSPKQFACKLCGLIYKQKTLFDTHMGMHVGLNPFTCVICKKTFTQKIALRRHMPMHTGENPYQCDECGKRFMHHTSYNIHKASHAGKKGYKCSECGFKLLTSSHLKRHMRCHTGEKNYECDKCNKKFGERYNLVTHQKIHQREKKKNVTAGSK